ncbi:carotenoid biosynthesis protein [bacterium]|nr:carotenoid biosynthesis protein [bacterium]
MERSNDQSFNMTQMKKNHLKIICLYILFGFGGLWHVLNWFQPAMQILASPLIIGVSLLLAFEGFRSLSRTLKRGYLLWCIIMLLSGFGIEVLGVHYRFPFGRYQYGQVLKPQIFQVPVAIGFAWLLICLSSYMLACRITLHNKMKKNHHNILIPFVTAAFMVLFDLIMEMAAPGLGYWHWTSQTVPVKNYLSWFVLGMLFSWLGLKLNITFKLDSALGMHVYASQMIYFILSLFKSARVL